VGGALDRYPRGHSLITRPGFTSPRAADESMAVEEADLESAAHQNTVPGTHLFAPTAAARLLATRTRKRPPRPHRTSTFFLNAETAWSGGERQSCGRAVITRRRCHCEKGKHGRHRSRVHSAAVAERLPELAAVLTSGCVSGGEPLPGQGAGISVYINPAPEQAAGFGHRGRRRLAAPFSTGLQSHNA